MNAEEEIDLGQEKSTLKGLLSEVLDSKKPSGGPVALDDDDIPAEIIQ